MISLPTRQVHLDFHTSELIPDVGREFDEIQFQQALKLGRVNSITLFAKCHHSWSYYPTKVGRVHPTLHTDLLGRQIDACHQIGVRAPIYLTVGWSANDAQDHPDWCVCKPDGAINATQWDPQAKPDDPRPIISWKFLCPSGDYLDLILRQTAEICRLYPVDGFFYDITGYPVCYCPRCRDGMARENVDIHNRAEVTAFSHRKWGHFMASCRKIIHQVHPDATLFFNATTTLDLDATPATGCCPSKLFEYNTHQELEDLPTTWGGYDKLPIRAKFFHRFDKPLLAMSGKFHTMWGEFGGFKHPDALRYEAASMIASAAGCSFGDQLHPSGAMDLETYRRIGAAYAYVEQIEAYSSGAKPLASLGLYLTADPYCDEGVAKMLLERQLDFIVVGPEDDLSPCQTIILTGAACLSPTHAEKLNAFVKNGGALLVLGESALDLAKQKFLLDVGAAYLGPANFEQDYLLIGDTLNQNQELVTSPFLNYQAALRVQPHNNSQILAAIREPYFNRTYAQYCSHQNTPCRLTNAPHPGALRHGRVIFLPHSLGEMYHQHGLRLHRDFFINALRLIYSKPMITSNLPSAARLSLLHQPHRNRYVAHLLYGPPLQRGRCLVIEDLVPLYHIPLELRVPQTIKNAFLIPDQQSLPLQLHGDSLKVTVPQFQCHCAVVFEY